MLPYLIEQRARCRLFIPGRVHINPHPAPVQSGKGWRKPTTFPRGKPEPDIRQPHLDSFALRPCLGALTRIVQHEPGD
jgi:hypothetical protein